MKICPICEKKIEGRFCTHCFRFVTPWNVSDHTYLNKNHDAGRDKNCDYHNPKTKYSSQEYMQPGYEKRIYGGVGAGSTNKQTRPVRQNKQTGKNGSGAKPSRIAFIIVLAIIVFSVLPAIVVYVLENDHNGSWGRREDNPPAYSIEMAVSEPETTAVDSRSIAGYLSALSFVTKEESYLGTYYYYDPEDIVGLTEYHCDYGHFDMTADEFFDCFLAFYGEEPLETDMERETKNNYLLDALTGKDTILLETEYEWTYGAFNVEVLADTASDELHRYSFKASDADDAFYDMIFDWCKEELPGRFSSVEDMKNDFSSNGGYLSEITADGTCFKVFHMGTYVSVEFGK